MAIAAQTQARDPKRPLDGLSSAEAVARKARGLANDSQPSNSRSYRRIIFENAFTPINSVLFAISIALVALGLIGDALTTAGLVLINVVVGVFQEGRAKRRLDQISLLARPRATVIRDGQEQEILPAAIVLGDLIRLRPGDEVQVDGVALECESFSVDESLLTGESDLVRKTSGDRLFSGSFCMAGTAIFEVDKVGADSMAQQVTNKARSFRAVKTPLQREVNLIILVMVIASAGLGIVVGGSFLNIYGSLPLKETVRAAAVIVALVPQGLSFMVTVTYAMAAVRIAGTGALVQRLNAVESMSHIDVLCLDKTGTLTTNALSLEALQPFGVEENELRQRLGTFAASASVRNRTSEAVLSGCPGESLPSVAEVPFDSTRKWSAIAFDQDAMRGLYVLGAPEMLKPHLPDGFDAEAASDEWLNQGLRVLIFAYTEQTPADFAASESLPDDLKPLGLIALRDELRHEARETVAQFNETGIKLKVLSGDNPETVASLARQTGIGVNESAISGAELDLIPDAGLADAVEGNAVFGRISPAHKDRLVSALQSRNHYVAMIGDGVNDVPALKRANVSIAMRSGSGITRSVSDIILLNDSFSVLPTAFREGQRIRNGMQGIIRLFLVRTLSVCLVILVASLLGDAFPTTPRQAGILAFLTVGLPAMVLAFWARPARTEEYLLPSAADFVLPAALTIALVSVIVYHAYSVTTGDVELSRTVLVLVGVLCGIILIPFVERTAGHKELLPNVELRELLLSLAMALLLLASLTIGPVRRFYELSALEMKDYGIILLAVGAWSVGLWLVWRTRFSFKLRASDLKLE